MAVVVSQVTLGTPKNWEPPNSGWILVDHHRDEGMLRLVYYYKWFHIEWFGVPYKANPDIYTKKWVKLGNNTSICKTNGQFTTNNILLCINILSKGCFFGGTPTTPRFWDPWRENIIKTGATRNFGNINWWYSMPWRQESNQPTVLFGAMMDAYIAKQQTEQVDR